MNPLRKTRLGILIVAMLFVASCSTNSLLTTGRALEGLGEQFIQTGQMYDQLLDSGVITYDDYQPWYEFALRFTQAYPMAVQQWHIAVAQGDDATTEDTVAAILQLKNQLLIYFLAAQAQQQTKEKS